MDGAGQVLGDDAALCELLRELDRRDYDFVAPTPATHRRVLARRDGAEGGDLRDILGWSLPFRAQAAPDFLLRALGDAGLLAPRGDQLTSEVRVSRVHGRLFLHSAFPTDAEDAVFLGPDSCRFADLIARALPGRPAARVVDVGGGAGVGAIIAAAHAPGAQLAVTDINPVALRFARINAAHAGVNVATIQTSALDGVDGEIDVVLANPPYMAASRQAYRDGGDMHGARRSVDWAEAALGKLRPGGTLLLYSGSAILKGGRDELRAALERAAVAHGASLDYRELDPDVFGEELETDAYADVERIAAVSAIMRRAP